VQEYEEQRRVEASPQGDSEKIALSYALRLRGQGKSLEEIAAGLKADAGIDVSPAAVDDMLRRAAGPAASERGADPAFFTGTMGGG
jgi:hypothetical protein